MLASAELAGAVSETERVANYRARFGDTWPPAIWETNPGWAQWVRAEERKLEKEGNRDVRWFEWLNLIQSMSLPSFSDKGFELVDCPERIWKPLRERLMSTPLESIPFENARDHDGIVPQPRFLDTSDLNGQVLGELKQMHEQWSGTELELSKAYGLRIYLPGSTLVWHLDKVETHVVSGILHIGSGPDQDAAPWPLEIIGLDGARHEVVLRPGQLLFYESAKLSHGRPSTFTGNWYTSVFLHYRPRAWTTRRDDFVSMVPPHWWPAETALHDQL